MRVWCGLVAVAFATALCGLGLGVKGASAGTPQAVETAQVAAPAATNGAIESDGSAAPSDVAIPAGEQVAANQLAQGDAAPAANDAAIEGDGSAMPADVAPPAGEGQQAGTNQVAQGDAGAGQEGPINLVILVRINSPGDNGPITQTNVVVADAGGSNTASTSQSAPTGGISGQDASTGQQVGASATATQDAAGNTVIVVRVNSPGNNGPVSQTNASLAASNARNSSGTTQSQPARAPASSSAPAKAAASPAPTKQAATAPAAPAPASPATSLASQGSEATAPSAVRAHHHRHAVSRLARKRARAAATAPAHSVTPASQLSTAIGKAGDLLGTVAPRTPLGTARRPSDVSEGAVLLSLLAALAIGAAFAGWSLRPEWLRQKRLPSLLR